MPKPAFDVGGPASGAATHTNEHLLRQALGRGAPVPEPDDIEIHPAARLFPMIDEGEMGDLVEDIRQHGQRYRVVMYQGCLLEGRNRWVACRRLGIEPRTEEYKGDSPTAFVLSANLRRRHLSPEQRAAVAARFVPLFEEEARQRMIEGGRRGGKGGDESTPPLPRDEGGRSVARAAAAAGAGVGSTKVLHSVNQRAPEVLPLAAAGQVKVQEAKKLADLPAPERKEAVERIQQGEPAAKVVSLFREQLFPDPNESDADAGPKERTAPRPPPEDQLIDWAARGKAWAQRRLDAGKEVPRDQGELHRLLAGHFADLLAAAAWGATMVAGKGRDAREVALSKLCQGARRARRRG